MKHPVLDKIYEAHNYLTIIESTPRDYGTGEKLYASEIHSLTAIAANPGCSLTELAAYLKVSKPAVSKFVRKLEKKGYLRKTETAHNAKVLQFHLTEKGQKSVEGHKAFERKTFGPLIRAEAGLTESERKTILSFLTQLSDIIS